MGNRIAVALGILMFSALGLNLPAYAQVKFGFVDSERILKDYKPFREAESEFKRYENEMQKEYADKENALKQLQDEYKRQELLLSDKKKEEMQREIQRRVGEIQKFVEGLTSPGGRLTRKNAELSAPIYKSVNNILGRVAKSEGYDFIFNAAQMAYANEKYDITPMVMEALNKELEEKKKGSPKAGSTGR